MSQLVDAILSESRPIPVCEPAASLDVECAHSDAGYSDWGDHADSGGWSDSGWQGPTHSDAWSDLGDE